MKKILLVGETTSTLTYEESDNLGIEMIPMSIIIDQKEYKDNLEISSDELVEKLKEGYVPTTSQPNIGYLEEKMQQWKDENWDAIIIVTLPATLSGTYQGFNMMKDQLEMDNVYLVDSHTLAGPVRDGLIAAKKMIDEGKDVDDILNMLDRKFTNTYSMLYPYTLEQLKKGGRISPVTAKALEFIKMKPLIYLDKESDTLEKYAIARTDTKIFDMMMKEFKKQNVHENTHEFYLPEICPDEKVISKLLEMIHENFGNITVHRVTLPAVLTCHAGLGCFALQSILK